MRGEEETEEEEEGGEATKIRMDQAHAYTHLYIYKGWFLGKEFAHY